MAKKKIRRVYFYTLLGGLDYFTMVEDHSVTKIDDYNAIINFDIGYLNQYYVNRMNGNRYFLHRSGGLPAMINYKTGEVSFFVKGLSKKIEELTIDDEMKVFLKLKYSLYDSHMSLYYHRYK